tara:strand:- start:1082 stop:1468 length:387 start_codon:yes stop_codon:yes gene_type:complete
MSELSNFLENKFLDITLKGGSAYRVATPYLGLFTSDPTDAGSGTECSWTNYARQSMAFGTVSNGSVASTGEITFPAVVGSSVTVTHIGVFDAATSGNLLYHTALDVSKALAATDTMSVAAGGVSVTLA